MDLMEYRRRIIASSPHLSHAEGAVATFTDGTDLPLKSLLVNIEPVQSGSGDPSPSNVRPISGWDAVNINACGVNIWDEQWEVGLISILNGQNVTGSGIRSKNYSPCTPSTEYRLVFGSGTSKYVFWYDADHNYILNNALSGNTVRFTSPSNAKYFRLRADTINTYNNDISVNYPSTDVDYHPYNGQGITVDLGQTVYGGKLDVLSGVLTVDRYFVDPSLWTQYNANNGYKAYKTGNIPKAFGQSDAVNKPLSNMISKFGSFSSSSMNKNIIQPPYPNPAQGYAYMALEDDKDPTSVEFSYIVQTPIEIQLTPHQIRTLYGNNTIFADTGNVALEYWAHP